MGSPSVFGLPFQVAPVTVAQLQSGSVLQDHDVFASDARLDFTHAIQIDDRAAMDACEPARVEASAEVLERVPDQVDFLRDMDPDIVVGGLDPVDFGRADEIDAPSVPDHDPGEVPPRLGTGGNGRRRLIPRQLLPHAGERYREPARIERLEEIVDDSQLERAGGVLVVRRDEHHQWKVLRVQGLEHVETAAVRQLHVEEDHVGMELSQHRYGFGTATACSHDLDVWFGL